MKVIIIEKLKAGSMHVKANNLYACDGVRAIQEQELPNNYTDFDNVIVKASVNRNIKTTLSTISCDGARNSVTLSIPPNTYWNPFGSGPGSYRQFDKISWLVIVNGRLIGRVNSQQEQDFAQRLTQFGLPAEYIGYPELYRIKPNQASYQLFGDTIRLTLVASQAFVSEMVTAIDNNPNPTLACSKNQIINVCLVPSEPISCDGATSEIFFDNITGDWGLEVDDVPIIHPYGFRSWFEQSPEFESANDGSMFIRNVNTSIPHRIRLIPLDDDECNYSFNEGNEYPTFMQLENGDIVFCLAPAEPIIPPPVISCDGATPQTGCIDYDGLFQLDIDGVNISSSATPQDIMDILNATGDFEVTICNDEDSGDGEPISPHFNQTLGMMLHYGDMSYGDILPEIAKLNNYTISVFDIDGQTLHASKSIYQLRNLTTFNWVQGLQSAGPTGQAIEFSATIPVVEFMLRLKTPTDPQMQIANDVELLLNTDPSWNPDIVATPHAVVTEDGYEIKDYLIRLQAF